MTAQSTIANWVREELTYDAFKRLDDDEIATSILDALKEGGFVVVHRDDLDVKDAHADH